MKKKYYAAIVLFSLPTIIAARLSAPTRTHVISNNGQTYTVQERGEHIGELNDGTWVKLVCIKKGMIGMPNISMSSYRGTYKNSIGEQCYVFVLESDGTITFNNQELKVYRVGNNGFLSDGTSVNIECLAPGAVAKIAMTPLYRGTYLTGDVTGKHQCHVFATEQTNPKKRATKS